MSLHTRVAGLLFGVPFTRIAGLDRVLPVCHALSSTPHLLRIRMQSTTGMVRKELIRGDKHDDSKSLCFNVAIDGSFCVILVQARQHDLRRLRRRGSRAPMNRDTRGR